MLEIKSITIGDCTSWLYSIRVNLCCTPRAQRGQQEEEGQKYSCDRRSTLMWITKILESFSLSHDTILLLWQKKYSCELPKYLSSFRFCGFWSSTPRCSTFVFVMYLFYQFLFIIHYFEVSMLHSVSRNNNDRKGGNRDIEETRKSVNSRRLRFLEKRVRLDLQKEESVRG